MDKITKHKELETDDFVKVSQTDGPILNRLNFTGQVVQSLPDLLEIRTFDGVVGVSLEDDEYSLEVSKLKRKPTGWDKFIKNPKKYKESQEVEVAPVVNKKSKVFKIVKENPRKKAPALLKLAQEEIGGGTDILKTYIDMGILKFR